MSKLKRPREPHQIFLVGLGILLTILVLIVPLVLIFSKALSGGWALLV
jgi:sulfate transport system permease protein